MTLFSCDIKNCVWNGGGKCCTAYRDETSRLCISRNEYKNIPNTLRVFNDIECPLYLDKTKEDGDFLSQECELGQLRRYQRINLRYDRVNDWLKKLHVKLNAQLTQCKTDLFDLYNNESEE